MREAKRECLGYGPEHTAALTSSVPEGVAANVIAQLAGVALGGPEGAVTAAALQPVFSFLLTSQFSRVKRLIMPSVVATDEPTALAQYIENNEDLGHLFQRSFRVATETEWTEHVDAMAKAWRDGATSKVPPDDSARIIRALLPMTADAVVVLSECLGPPVQDSFVDVDLAAQLNWTLSRLRRALRHLEDGTLLEAQSVTWNGAVGWVLVGDYQLVASYLTDWVMPT